MPSSGMSRLVTLVRTNVSEESIASIIRVARIVELGTSAVAPSLTRGRACSLIVQLLLVLPRAVTLGFKSHST
jgi:hypothetical protein